MVDVSLEFYFRALTSKTKLTNLDEVQSALRVIKFRKSSGRNGIPNEALKHLPKRVVYPLVHIFNVKYGSM
jgi:hypothetical protein